MYVISYLFFARRLSKIDVNKTKSKNVLLLSISFIMLTTIISAIIKENTESVTHLTFLLLAIYDIFLCVYTLIILYSITKSDIMKEESRILEHLLIKQKEQMEIAKHNIDVINIKVHDMKHYISNINNKLTHDEIEKLNKIVDVYNKALKTGNEALDVLLMEKSLIFERRNVILDCIADGNSLRNMSFSDIYSLFGNSLDNAFEAVKQIEDIDKRIISINIKEIMGFVSIHIQNNFEGTIIWEKDLPITTKSNTDFHGFGVKSIKMIVEKYKGTMSIHIDKNIFNLDIILPIKD